MYKKINKLVMVDVNVENKYLINNITRISHSEMKFLKKKKLILKKYYVTMLNGKGGNIYSIEGSDIFFIKDIDEYFFILKSFNNFHNGSPLSTFGLIMQNLYISNDIIYHKYDQIDGLLNCLNDKVIGNELYRN